MVQANHTAEGRSEQADKLRSVWADERNCVTALQMKIKILKSL